MKRIGWCPLMMALTVLCIAPAFGDEMTLLVPNPRDLAQRKAIIALVRAAKAVKADTNKLQLGLIPNEPNAAYHGNGLFSMGTPFLAYPQWALDAIMAHEMGHAVKRHVEKRGLLATGIVGGLAVLGALAGGDQEGMQAGAQAGQVTVALVMPRFSRGEELEADAYGVQILRAEGYRQAGDVMANMLGLLLRDYGNSGGGFFDSHPSTTDRIGRLRGR